jgi:hypothetical protein
MKKVFLWGFGLFFVCGLLWVISIIFAVLTLGKWSALANILGYTTLAILPITLILALIKKFRGRSSKKEALRR